MSFCSGSLLLQQCTRPAGFYGHNHHRNLNLYCGGQGGARRLISGKKAGFSRGSPLGVLQQPRESGRGKQAVVTCIRTPINIGNTRAPLTAWTPLRSLQSLTKFFFISGAAMTTAWFAHPHLVGTAAQFLHLNLNDNVTAFQTSFFSFLSLVFAIYSGNTMAFLYDRQKEMVKNLYAETMALEELLEESVYALGPDAKDILAQIRLYIEDEILVPENQTPPLGEGTPLSSIRSKARNYRRAGTDVGDILAASQRLAHAQSARQATACRLLPPVHWALLYSIGTLFVGTFILFETGGSFSNEGRHVLFTVLCGLMSFVLTALSDLTDPAEGVYNATALLETRLSYIQSMLDKYQKQQRSVVAALTGAHVEPSANAGQQLEAPDSLRERIENLAESAAQFMASGDAGNKLMSSLVPRESRAEPAALKRGEEVDPADSARSAPMTGKARPGASLPASVPKNGVSAPENDASLAARTAVKKVESGSGVPAPRMVQVGGDKAGPPGALGGLAPRLPQEESNGKPVLERVAVESETVERGRETSPSGPRRPTATHPHMSIEAQMTNLLAQRTGAPRPSTVPMASEYANNMLPKSQPKGSLSVPTKQ